MSLFKQLLTDLSDAASELSTTLTTDLSEARNMTRAELSSSSEAVSAAIGAALLTQRDDWDAEIASHHSSIDEAVHAALIAKMPPQYGAAHARVRRVLDRLQKARPAQPRVSAVVLRWNEPNAMVLFSHRVYVATALLDALTDDDALAFVLAHELTHIDRGDIRFDGQLRAHLPPLPPLLPLRYTLGMLTRIWMRPDMERAADVGGQALVVAAGYRADSFEAVFDLLEAQEGAVAEPDPSEWAEFWRQKTIGYPAISERRALLRAAL